jgi:hypothetical protein
MPARLVEDEDGVRVRRHHGADLDQKGMTRPAPLPSAGQIAPKSLPEKKLSDIRLL